MLLPGLAHRNLPVRVGECVMRVEPTASVGGEVMVIGMAIAVREHAQPLPLSRYSSSHGMGEVCAEPEAHHAPLAPATVVANSQQWRR